MKHSAVFRCKVCTERVRVRVKVRVRVRDRVRVRVRIRISIRVTGGDYFLRLHTPFSIVGLARQPYSVIVNHKNGRYSSRSVDTSDFVTVHGQTDYRYLVEPEYGSAPDAHEPQLPLKLSVQSSLPLPARGLA